MGVNNLFKSKKQEDQLYGIKDNLVSGIPREYGRGEHHVKLAYITPEEASILKKLDLYDSNPPHDGPKGIPNYNDGLGGAPGQGDAEAGGNPGGTAGDAAAHGNASSTSSGVVGSESGPVTSSTGVVTAPGVVENAHNQNMRARARALNAAALANINANPNLGMGDYNPSPFGISAGLTPTDGLSFGESLGYSGAQLGEALGAMSPGSIMGGIMGLAAGLPPGLGSIFGGLFGSEDSEDSEDSADKKSLFDRFGDLDFSDFFGPAQPTVEQGGNRIPTVASGTTIDADEKEKQALIDDLISRGFTESLAQRIVDSGKYFASYDE
jgi:hypothetical protein